jgi:ATP-binding protein involved in chromosome partitioning
MDPRIEIIQHRIKDIHKIIAISGGKGGIGKSSTASVLALILQKEGYKTGLLDLDFSGPSDHTILGVKNIYPEEDKGIIPPEFIGIRFMSITYYAGDEPAPLRGEDVTNAIIELLAITRWSKLDFLIIDMPPGIGDATLDTIRLLKDPNFLLLTTPSKLSIQTMLKTFGLLQNLDVPILGIIENMVLDSNNNSDKIKYSSIPLLGRIPFDKQFEKALGKPEAILRTSFYKELRKIVKQII